MLYSDDQLRALARLVSQSILEQPKFRSRVRKNGRQITSFGKVGDFLHDYDPSRSATAWKCLLERWIKKGNPPGEAEAVDSVCGALGINASIKAMPTVPREKWLSYIAKKQGITASSFLRELQIKSPKDAIQILIEEIQNASNSGRLEVDDSQTVVFRSAKEFRPEICVVDGKPDRVARNAGRICGATILSLLREEGLPEVNVAVGLGLTTQWVFESAARFLLAHGLTAGEIERLNFYQIGFACTYESLPSLFIPEAFEHLKSRVAERVIPPGIGHQMPLGWYGENIQISITSVADIRDDHSVVAKYAGGSERFSKLDVEGVVQCWPFTKHGYVDPEKLVEAGISLPPSAFTPSDLRAIAKSGQRHAFMVATDCPHGCGQPKDRALLPLLTNPKMRTFNRLIVDHNTWNKIAHRIPQEFQASSPTN